jgi:hypothetical protein
MNFVKVSDLKPLRNLERARLLIVESRNATLDYMISACAGYRPLIDAKVSVSRPDVASDTVIITTPFGNARSKNDWTVESSELCGVTIFEREREDKYGKKYWEPIWGLSFYADEAPRSGRTEDAIVIPFDDHYGNDRQNACLNAALAIVFGIINGPST